MNPLKFITPVILVIATAITALWVKSTFFSEEPTQVVSHTPTLEKIQNLAQLVTNKVYVSDVLRANNKDYEGLWVIHGDALLTIDLAKAEISTLNETSKEAVILLPQPQVTSPRVDHTRTEKAYIKGVRFALLRNPKNKSTMESKMMEAAQESIEKAASRPQLIENARQQAALIIHNNFHQFGWKTSVDWQPAEKLP